MRSLFTSGSIGSPKKIFRSAGLSYFYCRYTAVTAATESSFGNDNTITVLLGHLRTSDRLANVGGAHDGVGAAGKHGNQNGAHQNIGGKVHRDVEFIGDDVH